MMYVNAGVKEVCKDVRDLVCAVACTTFCINTFKRNDVIFLLRAGWGWGVPL